MNNVAFRKRCKEFAIAAGQEDPEARPVRSWLNALDQALEVLGDFGEDDGGNSNAVDFIEAGVAWQLDWPQAELLDHYPHMEDFDFTLDEYNRLNLFVEFIDANA